MSLTLLRADAPAAEQQPHRWGALVVLCAAALIINLDNTILNVSLPTLVRDLNATSSQLQWIVDSYAMVFAGLLLVGGSLADRFGRKRFSSLDWLFSPPDRSAPPCQVRSTC